MAVEISLYIKLQIPFKANTKNTDFYVHITLFTLLDIVLNENIALPKGSCKLEAKK